MKNTYKLTQGAILLAIFAVLLLITLYVPILGSVLNLFLALPFLLFGAKYDWKSTAVFTIAAILLSMILGSIFAIPLALTYGISGAVMGVMIREEKSRISITAAGGAAFLINLVVVYAVSVALFNMNFIQETFEMMRASFEKSLEILKGLGQAPDENYIKQFREAFGMLETLVPSFFVMISFFAVFLIQLVSFPFLKRFGIETPKWKPFRELVLPKSVLWYYLFTMLALMIMRPEEGTYWFWALVNLSFILQALMVVQGISFIFYITYAKKYPKALPIIVVVLLFLLPYMLSIVRILGIIDLGFDLRKRLEEK